MVTELVTQPETTSLNLDYLQARPVVTRSWRTLEIVLVGCGGTGSWLAPSLARLTRVMRDAGKVVRLTLIDPDRVESANVPRQNFCAAEVGLPKATALALRYGTAWGIEIPAIVAHFNEKHLPPVGGEALAVIVGCVDNAAARREIAEVVATRNGEAARYSGGPPAVWWLDCGNHKESGQVLLGSASSAEELKKAFEPATICRALPSPALQRPELLEALPDELPQAVEHLSCAQLALLSVQSLMVNQNIAAVAADYMLRLVMAGDLRKFATYIDLPSGATKSFYTTPEAVEGVEGVRAMTAVGERPA